VRVSTRDFLRPLAPPPHLHPARKATDIKISLGTRLPEVAKRLSRLLAQAGQSALRGASLHAMR